MPTVNFGISVEGGGLSIKQTIQRTADHPNPYEVSLPAAEAGTLTTRTTDTAGTITMADAGHTIQTGDIIDIYWASGVAYGATVGTVSGTSVPFTGASGDVLPVATTALTVDEQVQVNTTIDGDTLAIIAIDLDTTSSTGKGHIDMQDSGSATIEEIDLVGNEPKIHDITGGHTNVFTGNPITKSFVSNGDTVAAATLRIIALEDSTP